MKGTSAEVPFLQQSNRKFVAARPCSDIALRNCHLPISPLSQPFNIVVPHLYETSLSTYS